MASSASLEGIKKAVFFPFQGKKWGEKVLIGSALTFGSFIIPIIPAIPVFGYFAQVMQQIILKQEDPQLPEWNDWGALFRDGIKLWGAVILYLLPGLILGFGGYALFMGLDIAMAVSSTTLAQSGSLPSALPMFASGIGMFLGIAVMLLGFLLVYVAFIFIPPAVGNMIAKGNFGAAFRVREWWPVFKGNLTGYLLAVALALGLFSLMYMLAMVFYATIVLCCLLPFAFAFIAFILGLVGFSLFAVAYRDGMSKLAGNVEQPTISSQTTMISV
ncbi:MAG: DUF4013 domain-containing protein [Anaerolineales bacterium]